MSTIEEGVVLTDAVQATEPIELPVKTKSPISKKNVFNLLAYVVNFVLVYGVGTGGWIGKTNGELSDKYQTLVTPNSSAFIIWAVIFLSQGLFCVGQFLPRFRDHPMVTDGVSWWFNAVVATQVAWTLSFALEVVPLSLAFMFLIWLSLMTILYKQYHAESDGSALEFLLLRFPFAIHGGWITAASALNVNVLVVYMGEPAYVQLSVAIVSLAVLHAVSVWVLFNIPRPNWTMACVLAWAFGWIYNELGDPLELITDTFSADTIIGVQNAAIAVVVVICSQVVVRLGLLFVPSWNSYRNGGTDSDSATEEENSNEKV